MTPPPAESALPRCPHNRMADEDGPFYSALEGSHFVIKATQNGPDGCACLVYARTKEQARAAWAALCAPHALAESQAECERLRKALRDLLESLKEATHGPGTQRLVLGQRMDAARAALAAQGGGT